MRDEFAWLLLTGFVGAFPFAWYIVRAERKLGTSQIRPALIVPTAGALALALFFARSAAGGVAAVLTVVLLALGVVANFGMFLAAVYAVVTSDQTPP